MNVLKSGNTAVAAVEAAIRVLEDNEITNAGYGSNLTKEGIVECDAIIVDHLGRSGACGATPSWFARLNLLKQLLKLNRRDQEPNSSGTCDSGSLQSTIVIAPGTAKSTCWRRRNRICL